MHLKEESISYSKHGYLFKYIVQRNKDRVYHSRYIQGKKKDLSLLAHRVEQIDKYHPISCVVTGNYYSLNDKHEQALVCFQRAVKLKPDYYEAWTLLGHEYQCSCHCSIEQICRIETNEIGDHCLQISTRTESTRLQIFVWIGNGT